jgi:hypothetical protein
MLGTCFEERNLKLGFKKGEEGNLNFFLHPFLESLSK